MIIITSIFIGSLGGLNQRSLRKLIAYSSINHVGWIIAALIIGENIWEVYFLIYTFLRLSILLVFNIHQIYHINQNLLILTSDPLTKSCLFLLLLSLGGLPPFLGFLPKWLIIQTMADLNYQLLAVSIVIMTLITLFYYLRLTFLAFLFSYTGSKISSINTISPFIFSLTLGLTGISSLGLPFSSIIYSIL